jgi:hypothetical protein
MTWNSKLFRLVLVVGVLGALALALGANYVDFVDFWSW